MKNGVLVHFGAGPVVAEDAESLVVEGIGHGGGLLIG